MRLRFMRRLLLCALLLVITGSVIAQQPESTAAPPRVIDVWPLPGVEIAPNDGLTISFDWPMDQASVESAFSIAPALDGTLSWTDARTLVFTPAQPWPRSQVYTVTIGTDARSTEGVALAEPYTADVLTAMPLGVALVSPDDDMTDVPTDTRIIVSFDRPVVQLVSTAQMDDLPTPITISPAVEGTGEWVNTSIYRFTPAKYLDASTTYTVTVSDDLIASDGAPLETPFSWSFTTQPPTVTFFWLARAENVRPDLQIPISFSQSMDHASTEAAFRVAHQGRAVAGTFAWNDDSTTLTFTPDQRLELASTYDVSVGTGAKPASGNGGLREAFTSHFTTLPFPGVESTNPRNGDASVNIEWRNGANIYFLSPMNGETFRDRVIVDPMPANLSYSVDSWNNRGLSINFTMELLTEYIITLKAGAEDIYGNAISNDYTFSFKTGDLPNRAYPVVTGSFMVTGAHRDPTRIAIRATNKPNVDYTLYRVKPEELSLNRYGRFDSYYNPEAVYPWYENPDALVRSWSVQYDSQGQREVPFEVPLASEDGGQLDPGLYWLEVSGDNLYYYQSGRDTMRYALAVSTATVTVKRSHDEILVWVTDMQTSQPVAGTTVNLYNQGEIKVTGTTNADGLFRTPYDALSNQPSGRYLSYREGNLPESVFITAEGDGVFGAWYSNNEAVLATTRGYIYTDRPIYRPGEPIYFKGILRDRLDMTYTPPEIDEVTVTLGGYFTENTITQTLEVTEFGTFSGQFELPENAALGEYQITVDWGGEPFEVEYCYEDFYRSESGFECYSYYGEGIALTVADYRVPEYEVSMTPQRSSIIQGDPLNMLLEASYYFGGGVAEANVDWRMEFQRHTFSYENYSFYDSTLSGPYNSQSVQGSGVTNMEGQLLITSTDTTSPAVRYPGVPLRIRTYGTVFDASEQAINAVGNVIAHPSEVYVGVRTEKYIGKLNEPFTFSLVTVSPDKQIVPEQKVELELVETRWERAEMGFGSYEWKENIYPITTAEVTTDAEGKATFSFTPEKAGSYRLRAVTLDRFTRVNSSTTYMYVRGEGRTLTYYSRPRPSYVEMVKDKDEYLPKETAEVIVNVPFDISDGSGATALIAVERAGIMRTEVVKLLESSFAYPIPLTDVDAPGVTLTVWMVKGIDENNLNPQYASGSIYLPVKPTAKMLNVEITPSEKQVTPGAMLTLDVRVTDRDGAPVPDAEVAIKLTDEAVLDLLPDNAVDLLLTFYNRTGNYVSTSTSLSALLDVLTDALLPGGGMGGGGGAPSGGTPNFDIRDDFITTPLWAPHVITDADGRATVELKMPDNLTRWVADARVITKDTAVGVVETTVVSTLPLITRPAVPRFFVVGDQVELATVVNNQTDTEQTVTARIEAEGVTLHTDSEQQITIAPGAAKRVSWLAVVNDVQYVDLTFFASSADGYTDAVKPTLATGPDGTIPVYRYTAPDTVGTAGLLTDAGAITEAISLPSRLLDTSQGNLIVNLDPSLAATVVDAFKYLESFPYECIEQTVSRFLPNTVTYRALQNLGLDDPGMKANLERLTQEAVEKLLRSQNADGGFGWFGGMESSTYVTAYALLGLAEARDAGLLADLEPLGTGGGGEGGGISGQKINGDSPHRMMDLAANFLHGKLSGADVNTSVYTLNWQAFLRYVLARYQQGQSFTIITPETLDAIYAQRLRLSNEARAYLLMAYHAVDPENAAVEGLTADLNTSAILSATGAHWEEENRDYWGWGSNTRTTALALAALARVEPENPLLPNTVRWLMVARTGDHWRTTQETVWATIAFTDWMVVTGELKGEYEYAARLNGTEISDGQVTPDTVREQETLRVAVRDLLLDDVNRLQLARGEGEGALYYTAFLDLRLLAEEVEGINRGVGITREYFNADGEPISEARAGDTVTVRLTVNLPNDVYYFVLTDPLPAGLESIDPNLLTNVGEDSITFRRDDARWYWGYWAFDRTELRDEQTNLYADYLRRGTYVFTYQARAVTPGVFQTMPTHGYEFYFPEVFGRTDGQIFTVNPRAE